MSEVDHQFRIVENMLNGLETDRDVECATESLVGVEPPDIDLFKTDVACAHQFGPFRRLGLFVGIECQADGIVTPFSRADGESARAAAYVDKRFIVVNDRQPFLQPAPSIDHHGIPMYHGRRNAEDPNQERTVHEMGLLWQPSLAPCLLMTAYNTGLSTNISAEALNSHAQFDAGICIS